MPFITFLVPVRHREEDIVRIKEHLLPQIQSVDSELLLIQEESYHDPEAIASVQAKGGKVLIVKEHKAVFHKTRLLNAGLRIARGDFVVAYDSDLLPMFDLRTAASLILKSPLLILGGYRIMSGTMPKTNVPENKIILPQPAPEDCTGALYKQLTRGERFMVCPFFYRQSLLEVGGWDEAYVGWGCEDQDVLERYCQVTGLVPARCTDLLYLHFDHESQPGWNDEELIAMNREKYYRRL